VTILTEQYTKKLPLHERIGKVEVYRIPISKTVYLKKFLIWKWFVSHLNLLLEADIIHIHDVFYWILPFRLILAFKKVYITFHGYEGYPIKIRWIVARKIAELLTNGNICVGDFMKKWYFTHPTSVIYGGVRLKTINNNQKTKNNGLSAVFFGRLDAQTGVLEYVKAYEKIKAVYPKFRLTIVGEGELLRKIPKNIKVVPFTKNIESYISKNRYVFVSRYLSMLEALSLKREIIAVYDNPVKEDYLQMSPFKNYVSIAKNSEEIEKHVLDNLKTNKNNTKEGFLWAKKQTWEKIEKVYLSLWKQLN
jgi:glycosyltransferase involved in cell wall biosynthesis